LKRLTVAGRAAEILGGLESITDASPGEFTDSIYAAAQAFVDGDPGQLDQIASAAFPETSHLVVVTDQVTEAASTRRAR
jgi:hypothetical protein